MHFISLFPLFLEGIHIQKYYTGILNSHIPAATTRSLALLHSQGKITLLHKQGSSSALKLDILQVIVKGQTATEYTTEYTIYILVILFTPVADTAGLKVTEVAHDHQV